jgi:CheY-like chemotaxis protein
MPGIDGATLAAAVKADAEIRDVIFVMLTSIGHWSEVVRLEGADVDACLVKPVRHSQLLNTLSVAWSKKLNSRTQDRVAGACALATVTSIAALAAATAPVRALVAEDNPVNQRLTTLVLEKLGVQADLAMNGRQAIDMFERAHYDIIFMDCQMPEVNGYEAAQAIRRREVSHPRVAIIALTAEAIEGCRERCLQAGMDDYLTKPVKKEQLAMVLNKWTQTTRQAESHAGVAPMSFSEA